jgi:hypothetical protein
MLDYPRVWYKDVGKRKIIKHGDIMGMCKREFLLGYTTATMILDVFENGEPPKMQL